MIRTAIRVGLLGALALVCLSTSANAAFVSWSSRFFSGDISPTYNHDAAGYVAAWNSIAGNAPTAGYGDAGFDDWTGKSNQNSVPSGANSNYGLHAWFQFYVAPNNTGNWTFNLGNDAGFGGVALIDGAQLGIQPNNYWPVGPSGTANLTAGIHRVDLYSFEDCCDGPGDTTFRDPLHAAGPFLAVNNVNLAAVPEPGSLVLLGCGVVGLLAVARRRKN